MGLHHLTLGGEDNTKHIDLMTHGEDRYGPRPLNVRQVIDQLDFTTTNKQIIKGDKK